MAESGSLERSSHMMNEYLSVGRETLNELFSQRERVKGVQRKALDILNYLGIANSIMKSSEQMDVVDKWMVVAGMLLVLSLILFLWLYYR
jgi:hypothetical protein